MGLMEGVLHRAFFFKEYAAGVSKNVGLMEGVLQRAHFFSKSMQQDREKTWAL